MFSWALQGTTKSKWVDVLDLLKSSNFSQWSINQPHSTPGLRPKCSAEGEDTPLDPKLTQPWKSFYNTGDTEQASQTGSNAANCQGKKMKKMCLIRTSWLGSVWHCTFWSIWPLFVDVPVFFVLTILTPVVLTICRIMKWRKRTLKPPFSVRQCPKMGSIPSWIIWAIRSMCSDTCMYTLCMSLYVYTYVYVYVYVYVIDMIWYNII